MVLVSQFEICVLLALLQFWFEDVYCVFVHMFGLMVFWLGSCFGYVTDSGFTCFCWLETCILFCEFETCLRFFFFAFDDG